MITVSHPKYGVFNTKPLGVVWFHFQEHYNPGNTIMFDDLGRYAPVLSKDCEAKNSKCNIASKSLLCCVVVQELSYEPSERLEDPPMPQHAFTLAAGSQRHGR